jgi:cysteine dioxygenase
MKSTPKIKQKCIPNELRELVDYLEGIDERADLERLHQLLSSNTVSLDSLSEFVEFGDKTYRRNLISQGRWYELLCICWRSGQRSPIHDHAKSTCGLKILTGVATETTFEITDCGQIKAVKSSDCGVGTVCTSQDADIHQVSNLQSAGTDLVTLHIYSPPIGCMDTYSLVGDDRAIYYPKNANVICEIGDCI